MTCILHDREAVLRVKKEKLITLVRDPFDPIDRKLLDQKLAQVLAALWRLGNSQPNTFQPCKCLARSYPAGTFD